MCESWYPLLDPLRKSLNLLIGPFGLEIRRTFSRFAEGAECTSGSPNWSASLRGQLYCSHASAEESSDQILVGGGGPKSGTPLAHSLLETMDFMRP